MRRRAARRSGQNGAPTEIGVSIPAATSTRTVNAPPEQVWSELARFDRIVEWAPNVDHSEAMTTPPFGVGAARRVQVGRLTLVETVTRCDIGSTLAYTLEGLPPFVDRAVNRWVLEPAGRERTTITLTVDITPGPAPPMRIAAAVALRVMRRSNARLLDGLTAKLTDPDGRRATP